IAKKKEFNGKSEKNFLDKIMNLIK